VELLSIARETDATWVIPSEDEWYKASYHKNDGNTGNYFDYPTSSDAVPGNSLTDPDPGNTATYLVGSFVPGPPHWRTEVGDHENSGSPYGTFDQGGNVWEWNEAVIDLSGGSIDDADRGLRGGDYSNSGGSLLASFRSSYDPTREELFIGFRVSQVPEPTTLELLALGGMVFKVARSRKRK
jgi:formylglycine-generating enzyme required for sulfatase activity